MMLGSQNSQNLLDYDTSLLEEKAALALPVAFSYTQCHVDNTLRKRQLHCVLKEHLQQSEVIRDNKHMQRIPHDLFEFGINKVDREVEDKRSAVLEILSELAEDLHDFSINDQNSSQPVGNMQNGQVQPKEETTLEDFETDELEEDLLSSHDELSVESRHSQLIDPVDPEEVFGDESVSSLTLEFWSHLWVRIYETRF